MRSEAFTIATELSSLCSPALAGGRVQLQK